MGTEVMHTAGRRIRPAPQMTSSSARWCIRAKRGTQRQKRAFRVRIVAPRDGGASSLVFAGTACGAFGGACAGEHAVKARTRDLSELRGFGDDSAGARERVGEVRAIECFEHAALG